MANGFVQNLLTDAVKGFFGNDYLRDYTHASKTFLPDTQAYSPRFKFLFHVYFDINSDLISSASVPNIPEDHNYGLAVKSVQLPKYSFDLHTMNQYNRKRIVQTKIKYDPVNITMHDTNSGLITKLWHAYYSYYYKDGVQPDPLNAQRNNNPGPSMRANSSGANDSDINKRTLYQPNISNSEDWGYIGEPQSLVQGEEYKVPFFRAINIYGFNNHNFTLYRLINPIIENFTHDTYNYSEGSGIMENTMTLQYETVQYYTGAVDGKEPDAIVKEFGTLEHYDKTVSPISAAGSNGSILGQGGLIDGAGGVMDKLASGDYIGAIKQSGQLTKTFSQPGALKNAFKGDAFGAASDYLKGTPNRNVNFGFPTPSTLVNSAQTSITKGIGKSTGYYPKDYTGPR